MSRRVVYVAGPYRSRTAWGVEKNARAAEEVALALWTMGYAVVTPHLNTPPHFSGANNLPDEVWLEGDIEILKRCDLMVVVPWYKTSAGTMREIAEAEKCKIPVFYWPTDEDILREEVKQTVVASTESP